MAIFHMTVKTGKKGSAANHAKYIARQGKYGQDESKSDLVKTDHGNLPDWAEGNPSSFWNAADKHERSNGAAYKEYVITLPRELTSEAHQELVQEMIEKHIDGKPYEYAIHEPMGALDGLNHPHLHVMFSDRLPDGIERNNEKHFARHNPVDPDLGGCKKDSGGKHPGQMAKSLVALREGMASVMNAHLQKHGCVTRVDHRSNKDRGITKEPERYLGQARIKAMSPEEKELFKKSREGR